MSRMAGLRQNDHWCAALSTEEMAVLDVRDRFMTPLKYKLDLAENFDEFEPDEQERLNRKFPELVSLHEMLQVPTFVADKHYISGKSVAEWQLLAFERSLSGTSEFHPQFSDVAYTFPTTDEVPYEVPPPSVREDLEERYGHLYDMHLRDVMIAFHDVSTKRTIRLTFISEREFDEVTMNGLQAYGQRILHTKSTGYVWGFHCIENDWEQVPLRMVNTVRRQCRFQAITTKRRPTRAFAGEEFFQYLILPVIYQ